MSTPVVQTGLPEPSVSRSAITFLVWGHDDDRGARLAAALAPGSRQIEILVDEIALARALRSQAGQVLVADEDASLAQQEANIRMPLILIARTGGAAYEGLRRRAYEVLRSDAELPFVIERFEEHAELARRAAARQQPPHHCARCFRTFQPSARRLGPARRFAKFGSIALCGACIDELRRIMQHTDETLVEAPASRQAMRAPF